MLHVVGTSIGNVEDTSLRAVRTLATVDIILAEDTRSFHYYYQRIQELFNIYPQSTQVIKSFHDQNEFKQISDVLESLARGHSIALVSESGMPLISDPGWAIINHIIKAGYSFDIIPGATAFVTAAVMSGFPTDKLLFLGFLPKNEKEILRLIHQLKLVSEIFEGLTVVFYESPNRVKKTLEIFDKALPNVELCISRELTKKFEEVLRGKPSELKTKSYKGELAIAVSF